MEIRFFNGGYCRQLMALVDRRTWRLERFHAVFVAVRHPREGWVLIDTGYGDAFANATRRWPYRLYRWVTPVTPAGRTRDILRDGGIDPDEVRTIIVTHFHADHIGGLSEFPQARFVYHAQALEALRCLSPWAQVRRAYLPALVPDDFAARSKAVPSSAFRGSDILGGTAYDLFGDESISLIPLPGHAPGHIGVFLRAAGDLLYAADAFWHHRQIEEDLRPMALARCFIEDMAAYDSTVSWLRRLHRTGVEILGCHCPRTQKHVAAPR